MDEYTTSWSDAVRVEGDFGERLPLPGPSEDAQQFGTLGRALWERALARVAPSPQPVVHSEEARKTVEGLDDASKPC